MNLISKPNFSTFEEVLRFQASSVRGADSDLAFTYIEDDKVAATLNFAELYAEARSIAAHIQAATQPGDRVLLLYPTGLEFISAFFACMLAGVVAVPAVLTTNPRLLPRLHLIARDAGPTVVLTVDRVLARLRDQSTQMGPELAACTWLATDALEDAASGWQHRGSSPDDLAFLQYTSGSTAAPKGVMVSQANLLANARVIENRLMVRPRDVTVSFLPPYHDMGLIGMIVTPLCTRMHSVQISPASFLLRPHRWISLLSQYRANLAGAPNFAYELCARKVTEEQKAGLDLSALEVVLNGSEPVRASTIRRFAEAFAVCGFHPRAMFNGYGLAEATLMVSASGGARSPHETPNILLDKAALGRGEVAEPEVGSEPVELTSSGRMDLIEGHDVMILDAARNVRLPEAKIGEICVCGPSVALGYWQKPDATAATFVHGLAGQPGTWLRTGDLGFINDGFLYVSGRSKEMMIFAGRNVFPQDVEVTIAAIDPGFRQDGGAAFSIDEGTESKLVIVQEIVRGAAPDMDALVPKIRSAVAEHHGIFDLAAIILVKSGGVPRTSSGKIQRLGCRNLFLSGELDPVAEWRAPSTEDNGKADHKRATTATEATLISICEAILGIENVSTGDNFFALGGNSLLAATLLERLKQAHLETDIYTLFSSPTLAELARALEAPTARAGVPDYSLEPGAAITPELLPLARVSQVDIDLIASQVPGGISNIKDIYRLTPVQEGILFHHLSATQNDPYLMESLLAFDSADRLDRFVEALQTVVDRHDALRSAIIWQDIAEPVQVVWGSAKVAVTTVDLPGKTEDAVAALNAFRRANGGNFDLTEAPLMRAWRAYDPRQKRWLLLLSHHHIVSDNTTIRLLFKEIRACLKGQAGALAEPLPFRNLVAQASRDQDSHRAFFKAMLGDVREPTLPFGLTEVRSDGAAIEETTREIDLGLARRLREQARRLEVSVASLFHLAWAQVIARTSGRTDVVFGTVLLGRLQAGGDADRMMGLCINTLPLRVRLGEAGIDETLKRLHLSLAELIGHEHASLALAQQCSGVEAPAPLFSSMLNYRHTESWRLTDIETGLDIDAGTTLIRHDERSNYPLNIFVDDLDDGFSITAQAVAQIGAGRLADYMQTALAGLLQALETDPHGPVLAVDVMPRAEREKLLIGWNRTDIAYDKRALIHTLFEAQVARTPDAIAVSDENLRLSYAQFNARANRLAARLQAFGVGPDTRVGICVGRSLDLVTAIYGVMKAGGAYVPLDPEYPKDRLRHILADSAPKVVITEPDLEALLRDLDGTVPVLSLAPGLLDGGEDSPHIDAAGIGLSPSNLCYIIYTSGSTGTPKGIAVEHRNAVNLMGWACREFDDARVARSLFSTSLNFDLAVFEYFVPLLKGGAIHVVRNALSLIEKPADITMLTTVPSAIAALVEVGAVPDSVTTVNLAGEPLKRATVEAIFANTKVTRVCNLYGPSETTVFSTWVKMDREEGFKSHIGHQLDNTVIYIVDPDGRPTPIGVPGELWIGGDGVARGYLNRPELTAERFTANPFSVNPGDRIYKSGDIGRYTADGDIEFLGRNDFQIKIRGFRVELGEIEARLTTHDAVREAVVAAREDNGGNMQLIAYLVLAHNDADLTALSARLQEHVAAALPAHMIPSRFVRLDTLPLTANGKIDRKALPAPDAVAEGLYEEPQGEIENKLALIWQELLGIDRVGRNDNFFSLGGQSLLVVRLIERMRRVGLHTDVPAIFAMPTLAALAGVVDSRSRLVDVPANRIAAGSTEITPDMLPLVRLSQAEIARITSAIPGGAGNIQDIYPLAPIQESMLYHHLLAQTGDPYLLATTVSFSDKGVLDRFLSGMEAVIGRHDILRTAIVWEGLAEPVQVVQRSVPLAVETVDLDPAEGPVIDQLKRRYDPRHYRIDLRKAPLLRGVLAHDRAENRWVLVALLHHGVGDHSTLHIVMKEIAAHMEGRFTALPPAQPFRNFVAQARFGTSKATHAAFFGSYLSDVEEGTYPFGLMDVGQDGSGARSGQVRVDDGLVIRLREGARRHGGSLASLLHLAWALVVGRTAGREDVVFGTVLFGRMQAGSTSEDGLVGPCINTLPVRVRLGGQPVSAALGQLHGLLAELMQHEHGSLADAVRASGVPAQSPLFSAVLNVRHSPEGIKPLTGDSGGDWVAGEALQVDERSNYPLSMSVDDLGDGLVLTAQVEGAADPDRVCAQMLTALEQLADGLAAGLTCREIDVLPEAERTLVVDEPNRTHADYPRHVSIQALFEAQVDLTPDAMAVIEAGAGITYAELDRRANRLANGLLALGVQRGERVAVMIERSIELVIAELAILKAGAAYLPLDPSYPAERLRFMATDSAARFVLGRAEAGLPELGLKHIDIGSLTGPETRPGIAGSPMDLAYVIYTSGSTGQPKGVMTPHGAVVQLVRNAHYAEFTASDRIGFAANPAFDASTMEVWGALLNGGAAVVIDQDDLLDANRFRAVLGEQAISILFLPVGLFNQHAHAFGDELKQLRYLMVGGEALDPRRIAHVMATCAPQVLMNIYGPTETTTYAMFHPITGVPDPERPIPLGRPLANTQVYILDQHGRPCPIGVTGEIHIGGDGLALGYLNRPELTAERFIPSPFAANQRLYRTGDLGRRDGDGTIAFLGRNDFQVKLRGFRIELGEIEAALTRQAGVGQAVVIVRGDVAEERQIVAYYTATEAAHVVNPTILRAALSAELPAHHIPSAFVVMEAFPLTPNGKLDRRALPAPDAGALASAEYAEPQGPAEQAIAAIVADILELDRVGRHDNFFELGGTSLMIVGFMQRLTRAGYPVDLQTITNSATIAELAEAITARGRETN